MYVARPNYGEIRSGSARLVGEAEYVKGYVKKKLPKVRRSMKRNRLDAWHSEFGGRREIDILARDPKKSDRLLEVVIGRDDRKRILGTRNAPWRWICSLDITSADGGKWVGTGWLGGDHLVMTAGHCVYSHNTGGWVKRIEVSPGRNGSKSPFGTFASNQFLAPDEWVKEATASKDYGAIILPVEQSLGVKLGYFGYGDFAERLQGKPVSIAGYPADKSPMGSLWYHSRAVDDVDPTTLIYDIDTAGGQSGAPVWGTINGERYVVGIHTNGYVAGNSATRINEDVIRDIRTWIS